MKENNIENTDFEKIDIRRILASSSSSDSDLDSDSEQASESTYLRSNSRRLGTHLYSAASTSSAIPTSPITDVLKALLETAKIIVYPEWRAMQLVGALYSVVNTFSSGLEIITAMEVRNNTAAYLTPLVGIPALLITAFHAAKISPALIKHCERALQVRANSPRSLALLNQFATTSLRAGRSVLTAVESCDRVATATTDGMSNVPFLNQLIATLIVLGILLDKDEPIGTEVDTSFFVGYLTLAICSVIGILIAIQGYYQLLNAKYPTAERSTVNRKLTHGVTRFALGAVGGAATWHAIIFWLMLLSGPGVVEEKIPYFTRLALTLFSFFVSGYLLSRPEVMPRQDADSASNALLMHEERSTSDASLVEVTSTSHAVLLSELALEPNEELVLIPTHSTKERLMELWNHCLALCTLNTCVNLFKELLDLLNGLMLNIGFLLLIYAASSETRLSEDVISDQTWSWLVVAPLLTTTIVAIKQVLYMYPGELAPVSLPINETVQSSYQSFSQLLTNPAGLSSEGYLPSGETSDEDSYHGYSSTEGALVLSASYLSQTTELEPIEGNVVSSSEEELGSENGTRYTKKPGRS
jgi:hypothetical protein